MQRKSVFFVVQHTELRHVTKNLILPHACNWITRRCCRRRQRQQNRYCLRGERFSLSHSLQVFRRVIYCIITELHNKSTKAKVCYVRWNVVTICVYFTANVRYEDHIKSFVSLALNVCDIRRTTLDSRPYSVSNLFITWWYVRYDPTKCRFFQRIHQYLLIQSAQIWFR